MDVFQTLSALSVFPLHLILSVQQVYMDSNASKYVYENGWRPGPRHAHQRVLIRPTTDNWGTIALKAVGLMAVLAVLVWLMSQ